METHKAKSPAGYQLLDSGDGKKLERFGEFVLDRPCAQAVWRPRFPDRWKTAHARFDREQGNRWHNRPAIPESWTIRFEDLSFILRPTDFGHLGLFPEQGDQWRWLRENIAPLSRGRSEPLRILNLFAYSGAATVAAARAGASVCHLDASKGMVGWARENAELNGAGSTVRWIVDDVQKFLNREKRRDSRYDGIIMDPPTFGRGPRGEVFKVENSLVELLDLARSLLSRRPAFVLLTSHTTTLTPVVLSNLLEQGLDGLGGNMNCGEMLLHGNASGAYDTPCGAWARWAAGG